MAYLAILISYLLGSIPSGLLLSRAFGLGDPRNFGSGNIGASNLTRLGGRKLGALTFLCDFFKGLIPVWICLRFSETNSSLAIYVGFAAVCGHCFSIYLKFKGGKGVATSAGVFLPLAPLAALIGLITWIAIFYAKKITSLAALAACLVIPSVIGIQEGFSIKFIFACGISALIYFRHIENIKALLNKSERAFGPSGNKSSS